MDIRDTTARLRRTFHYPTDDSSNGGTPEVLDEEEQENLIQTLSEQNATTNQQYQTLLLALPVLASIPYVLALFRAATLLAAVLGLTSLAATALLLLRLPATETGFPALDAWARSRSSGAGDANHDDDDEEGHRDGGDADGDDGDDDGSRRPASGPGAGGPSGMGALDQMRRHRRRRRRSSLGLRLPGAAAAAAASSSSSCGVPRSPLERWLPYLNLGLCAILVASGLLRGGDEGAGGPDDDHHHHPHPHPREQFGLLGLGNLPAIVYAVVIVAKVVMASVDPERELAALRYGYKGA